MVQNIPPLTGWPEAGGLGFGDKDPHFVLRNQGRDQTNRLWEKGGGLSCFHLYYEQSAGPDVVPGTGFEQRKQTNKNNKPHVKERGRVTDKANQWPRVC